MNSFVDILNIDASLNEKLAKYFSQLEIDRPDIAVAYTNMVDRLIAAGAGNEAPEIGDRLPEFLLPDHQGHLISSRELLESGPLVVSFNRGYWCSFCRFELLALADIYPEIKKAGGNLVSIMPERAASIRQTIERNQLPFTVVSDIDNGYALECGLMISLGRKLKGLFLELGNDLSKVHGNDGWFVPIPANFVLGQDGTILARFVDADFRRRMDTSEILKQISPIN